MNRKLPFLARRPARLLAVAPRRLGRAAPPSFAGHVAAGADQRSRLRADGEQRREERQAADVLVRGSSPRPASSPSPTSTASIAKSGSPPNTGSGSCPSSGARPNGRRREPVDPACRDPWQRWGWTAFLRDAVDRYGPYGSFWLEHPAVPYLPIRSWEIWNEENIVTFSSVDRARPLREAAARLGPGPARNRPRLEGHRRRPLRSSAADPAQHALRRLPLPPLPGPQREGVLRRRRAAPLCRRRAARCGPRSATCGGSCASTTTPAPPLYMTEIGWGSDSYESRWERGLRGQARELNEAMSMLVANRASWHIDGVWWFSWTDLQRLPVLRLGRAADRRPGSEARLVPVQRLDRGRPRNRPARELRRLSREMAGIDPSPCG